MTWVGLCLIAAAVGGLLLRHRYGNLHRRIMAALAARTGITSRTVVLVLGGATLVIWVLVAWNSRTSDKPGLPELFPAFEGSDSSKP